MLKVTIKDKAAFKTLKDNIIINLKLASSLKAKIKNEKDESKKAYWQLLFDNIEAIILAKPYELENKWLPLLKHINKDYINDVFQKTYKKFSTAYGYNFVKAVGTDTCPYCNRNYIYSVGNKDNKGQRPDLDHFLNKSDYPYFAVSLYNLIPACKQCNTSKRDDSFSIKTHLHPYYEGIDGENSVQKDVVFSYTPKDLSFMYAKKTNFEIGIRRIYDDEKALLQENKLTKNFEALKLNKLYELHKDYVLELIKKANIYDESYLIELASMFPDVFHNKEEARDLVLNMDTKRENLHKRPLSKLTHDIAEELGLLP